MIKPNELRKGSFVIRKDIGSGEDRIESVLGIGEKVTVSGPIEVVCEYEDIDPIHLTEEWLIKFGFKWVINHYELNRINICPKSTGFLTPPDFSSFHVSNIGYKISIKYVHQLQNLHFVIMGEELTIKEIA